MEQQSIDLWEIQATSFVRRLRRLINLLYMQISVDTFSLRKTRSTSSNRLYITKVQFLYVISSINNL